MRHCEHRQAIQAYSEEAIEILVDYQIFAKATTRQAVITQSLTHTWFLLSVPPSRRVIAVAGRQ